MDITEVRIKLVPNSSERLRAFCSITLDGCFVVRDLKIIEGLNGAFVAMPSRKLTDRCPRCGCKNHLRSKYCNECGAHLQESRAPKDGQGRAKLHADIAHPINAACRERIQRAVVEAFEQELERSKSPDYKPQSFDDFENYDTDYPDMEERAAPASSANSAPNGERSRDESFKDYNSLIADLKRDAADRRAPSGYASDPSRLPPAEGENALGKPAYIKRPVDKSADASSADKSPVAVTPADTTRKSQPDAFGEGLE